MIIAQSIFKTPVLTALWAAAFLMSAASEPQPAAKNPVFPGAPKLDGRSMISIVADPKAASAHEILHFAWAKNWAVRRGDWKLIGAFEPKTGTMRLSLHNLAESKPEVKDHATEQPEIVKQLMALHVAWEKEVDMK